MDNLSDSFYHMAWAEMVAHPISRTISLSQDLRASQAPVMTRRAVDI